VGRWDQYREDGYPLPGFFVSIDSKRVTKRDSVSIESKEVKVRLDSMDTGGRRTC